MVIRIKLLGYLRDYLPEDKMPVEVEVADGATVGEVFDHLHLPREKPRIILVNHQRADLDRVLANGDYLVALPPVAGG